MRDWLIALCLPMFAPAATARDVAASAPRKLSVTIYRAPYRNGGSISLDRLDGFALVTETRLVHLPAGESRLRFEGVVDGILPASAIVTGLPGGVIEKNRDAAVLSPEALVRAALGGQVRLVRTDRKTGIVVRTAATIRSANEAGVVFETAQGIEALRCSGLPETFSFSRIPVGLSSTPTLSVLTQAPREITAPVTLSYLADGFDWAANYVATLNPDGRTLDLSAWITLANGNGVGLPNAGAQVVAGRLNREWQAHDLATEQTGVIARCWPQGTTSDQLPPTEIELVRPPAAFAMNVPAPPPLFIAPPPPSAPAPPPPPPPETLGDLKLYRVAEPTTVAARQSKQVRLLEQAGVPFTRLAGADLAANGSTPFIPATVLLRTKNDLANNLGLPLPSGGVAVFGASGARQMLLAQANLRDTAVDEDVELRLGASPDLQVRQSRLSDRASPAELVPLTPELLLAFHGGEAIEEVEITNARDTPAPFELRLYTGAAHVTAANPPMGLKDGRPIFRLTIPANGAVTVRYTVITGYTNSR